MKKVLAALLVGLLTLALSGVAGATSDRMAVDIFAKGKGTDARGGTFNFLATDLDGNPDTPATGHVSYEIGSGSTFQEAALLFSPLMGRLLVFAPLSPG
jgi:hypothetical protein